MREAGLERAIAVDELTILCAYRVWRSTLILSIASCYLMWGKFDLALCYPLFPIFVESGRCCLCYFLYKITNSSISTTVPLTINPPLPHQFPTQTRTSRILY